MQINNYYNIVHVEPRTGGVQKPQEAPKTTPAEPDVCVCVRKDDYRGSWAQFLSDHVTHIAVNMLMFAVRLPYGGDTTI